MQYYCDSLTEYKRLATKEVKIGDLLLGNFHPIRVQTMTTTDTMDTMATVEQSIRCIEAGAELIRITAPSKNEAENLLNIKNELHKRGYKTPLVADIHFTPNAAEIAARIVEKVRVNPGNYVDKKKFEQLEYTNAEYAEEIERIRDRFTPLVKICKEYGTAMRIGTNHGSLSDRIMSRYGDTAIGMVESAMEFLRIARDQAYHNIILSMKSSNPQVMVQAYRLLTKTMFDEFGECYPLHLGVTEAGDGEDGRIKSAAGTGTLLEDGLGDTIRVSLTEDPEFEIPVCKDLVKRYGPSQTLPRGEGFANAQSQLINTSTINSGPPTPQGGDLANAQSLLIETFSVNKSSSKSEGSEVVAFPLGEGREGALPFSPFEYRRRETFSIDNIGGKHVPVVIADLSKLKNITHKDLQSVGYTYDEATDKWTISDAAADYIFTGNKMLDFALPGTLKVIILAETISKANNKNIYSEKYFPIFDSEEFKSSSYRHPKMNFVMVDCSAAAKATDYEFAKDTAVVLCLSSTNKNAMQDVRSVYVQLMNTGIKNPVINITDSNWATNDEHLVHFATETGALFLDGFGDGICLGMSTKSYEQLSASYEQLNASGRNYANNKTIEQFINNTSFGILQATRTRISKTEYISCPSCGRTLFDLQETTAKIRAVTNHLKGIKIAIMGCIVNGPGEMADADFGYVGSGPGKITLYKGKEVIKKNVNSEVAVEELIKLIKENEAWIEP
jgi:(E)-4-hydroxy-3-methylbut-2-enyl-diphosphate synthase